MPGKQFQSGADGTKYRLNFCSQPVLLSVCCLLYVSIDSCRARLPCRNTTQPWRWARTTTSTNRHQLRHRRVIQMHSMTPDLFRATLPKNRCTSEHGERCGQLTQCLCCLFAHLPCSLTYSRFAGMQQSLSRFRLLSWRSFEFMCTTQQNWPTGCRCTRQSQPPRKMLQASASLSEIQFQ